jgi:hypothetical protein
MVLLDLPKAEENIAILGLVLDLIYPGLGMLVLGVSDRTNSAPSYSMYGVLTFASPLIIMVIWIIIYLVVTFIGSILTAITFGFFAIVWVPAMIVLSIVPFGIVLVPFIARVICLVNNLEILQNSKVEVTNNGTTQQNVTTQNETTHNETTQNENVVQTQYDPNVGIVKSEDQITQTTQENN